MKLDLRAKIIGGVVAGLILSMCAMAFLFYWHSAKQIRQSLETERLTLVESVEHAIETGLRLGLSEDFADFVQDRLSNLSKNENFYAGVVYDPEFTPLMVVSPQNIEAPSLAISDLESQSILSANGMRTVGQIKTDGVSGAISTLIVDDELFGYIALFYQNATIKRHLRQAAIDSAIAGGLASLVSGILLGVFLNRLVHPLGVLTKHTISCAEGVLEKEIEYQNRKDEVGDLARAIEQFRAHVIENDGLLAEREIRQKELEEALEGVEKVNALLETQKVDLEQLAYEAQQANIAKTNFLANMSHEIRTPMNGILGIAEVMQSTQLDAHQRELASIIVSSASALMYIINDILDISKIEAGKITLVNEEFDLLALVKDVSAMMQARIAAQNIELIFDIDPNIPTYVSGDASRLRQILTNLVGNAVKFTEQGYILISIGGVVAHSTVHLSIGVEDTGVGIPEEDFERIFDKFEQVDGTKSRKFEGTGLGLSITKDLIELMGGKIFIESKVGKGTKFTISLSLPVAQTARNVECRSLSSLAGKRVLAVDDNEVNRRILSDCFERWDICHTIVSSAQEAFSALEKSVIDCNRYHVVLSDFHMPQEDGEALCIRMQEDERFLATPVIIFSSMKEFQEICERNLAKPAAFLAKPILAEQLLFTLGDVLMNRAGYDGEGADDQNFDVGNLSGDTTGQLCQPSVLSREMDVVSGNMKILIADDNIVNQQVIRAMIGNSYVVEAVENGALAVEKLLEFKPDLIFMDISMPVMDGHEATIRIREIETRLNLIPVPIIAVTAHAHEDDHQKCANSGINDVVTKPVHKAGIEEALGKWLPSACDETLNEGSEQIVALN